MKVYVITAGEYSDYQIYGVAVDKTIAQQIADRVNKFWQDEGEIANIEEYDTDSWTEIVATGDMYDVYKCMKNGGRLDVYKTKNAIDSRYKNRNKVKKVYRNHRDIMVTVVARDEEHAKKIAADLFAEYEYRQAMKEPKQDE